MYDPPGYVWAIAIAGINAIPAHGPPRRPWFNAFGITDLVVAMTLGALTGYQLLNVTPSGEPIRELRLALIPTAAVPLLLALRITSVFAAQSPTNTAASHRPVVARHVG